MRVITNTSAINAGRNMGNNVAVKNKSIEKLSSGLRVNRAADDSAGLAISEKMRSQVRCLQRASQNSLDGISLVQTAEGAMQEAHNILQRMRELAVQSASDTNENLIDRRALDEEYGQLLSELDNISDKTEFNRRKILNGSLAGDQSVPAASGFTVPGLMVFADPGTPAGSYNVTAALTGGTPEVPAQAPSVDSANFPSGNGVLAFVYNPTPNADTGAALNGVTKLSVSGSSLSDMTVSLGPYKAEHLDFSNFTGTIDLNFGDAGKMTLTIGYDAYDTPADVKSGIESGNFAFSGGVTHVPEKPNDTISLTMNGSGISRTADLQVGDRHANFGSILMRFSSISATDAPTAASLEGTISVTVIPGSPLILQTGANQGDELQLGIEALTAESLGIHMSNIAGAASSGDAITAIDDAINFLSMSRARLGAMQNRLESKVKNLDNSAENLQSAESRIRDTDMAKEMSELAKDDILTQSSTSMLAQANTAPEDVLKFFQ